MKWISDQEVGLMFIHQFLLGEMENTDGLSIFHFAVFTHEELESTDDFFQWVFCGFCWTIKTMIKNCAQYMAARITETYIEGSVNFEKPSRVRSVGARCR